VKSIYQLIPDVYYLVSQSNWQSKLVVQPKFGSGVRTGALRLSQMGPKCPRALWYQIHHPELAEPLPPSAEIKYTFGHIMEAMVIELAKLAGHTVEGEQDELNVLGIAGHRDCVIDGCLVDIKSQSTRAIEKLRTKTLAQDDPFGYLDQLDGYSLGSLHDPLVKIKDKAYLLGIDKTLGHMCLYEHEVRHDHIQERIRESKSIVAQAQPPECRCGVLSDDSGNVRLDMRASYSPQKHTCFPQLRTFIYSGGPVYFTKVVKVPKYHGIPLKEVDKSGKIVYGV
jgi:hypothetical protein